jgi:GNAT superfamily N-acetyltransferase
VITIGVEPLASPDARRLIDALNADISARYPNPEDNFFELDENEVAERNGAFVIAREDGAAIGCGAVRRIGDGTGEVKRMYVAPSARGKRLGARILAELEVEARKLGITRLVLETGERQGEAIALYEREGFKRIPKFGEYVDAPLSVCFGKDL